jgi:hypothetical protein
VVAHQFEGGKDFTAAFSDCKATEKKAVAEGKRPFYMKKSEQRKMELLAKYQVCLYCLSTCLL